MAGAMARAGRRCPRRPRAGATRLSPPHARSDRVHACGGTADRVSDSALCKVAHRSREVARIEPADIGDFGAVVNPRLAVRMRAKHEVMGVDLGLPVHTGQMLDLELDSNFFAGLAPRRLLNGLARFPATAGKLPIALAVAMLHKEDAAVLVEDDTRGPQHPAAV